MSSSKTPLDAVPTEDDLVAISKLPIVDETGQQVPFGSLFEHQRTIVIFIRHFHCGLCSQYLLSIAEALPPATLERCGMKLVVVGCGSYEPIADYRKDIEFSYPVYGHPSREIHRRLGFVSTLEMSKGTKPSYLRMSQSAQIWGSFKKAVSNLGRTFQVGSYSQNGGELVLGPGPM